MTQLPQPNNVELTQIGHYSIISRIGRGGMGLVYLARDTRLDRQVAIKCLRTELFEPRYRERFKREALLLARLNHPNIVQIYDYQETEDQLALVMEYVEGQNLQQHLRENIVPLTQRMQWLAQIAQGLAVAHDAGIVHLPDREPYVVVILTEWKPEAGGRQPTIARISRAVYEYVTDGERAD